MDLRLYGHPVAGPNFCKLSQVGINRRDFLGLPLPSSPIALAPGLLCTLMCARLGRNVAVINTNSGANVTDFGSGFRASPAATGGEGWYNPHRRHSALGTSPRSTTRGH